MHGRRAIASVMASAALALASALPADAQGKGNGKGHQSFPAQQQPSAQPRGWRSDGVRRRAARMD
jgi:hypothetical protein